MLRTMLIAVPLLASTPTWSQPTRTIDDWVDACYATDADLVQLLENEALLVHRSALTPNPEDPLTYSLVTKVYTESGLNPPFTPLCPASPFYGQLLVNQTPARSAIQVGRDLVLTAWHCHADPAGGILEMAAVFGLRYRSDGSNCMAPDFAHVPAGNVFWVTAVVADGIPPGQCFVPDDFLLLRLDRSVSNTYPRVRRSGQGQVGDDLTMMGHPDRLATKVDLAGNLVGFTTYFNPGAPVVENLHTLVGSSGAMVYNRDERFIETVARTGVGTSYASCDPPFEDRYRVIHSNGQAAVNDTIKIFARHIPAFELLVQPLDKVVHTGSQGGPLTNPSTMRTIRSPSPGLGGIDYEIVPPDPATPHPTLILNLHGQPLQGTLLPGESFPIEETFDAGLACGIHDRTYSVIDHTHGLTDVVRHHFEIVCNSDQGGSSR